MFWPLAKATEDAANPVRWPRGTYATTRLSIAGSPGGVAGVGAPAVVNEGLSKPPVGGPVKGPVRKGSRSKRQKGENTDEESDG